MYIFLYLIEDVHGHLEGVISNLQLPYTHVRTYIDTYLIPKTYVLQAFSIIFGENMKTWNVEYQIKIMFHGELLFCTCIFNEYTFLNIWESAIQQVSTHHLPNFRLFLLPKTIPKIMIGNKNLPCIIKWKLCKLQIENILKKLFQATDAKYESSNFKAGMWNIPRSQPFICNPEKSIIMGFYRYTWIHNETCLHLCSYHWAYRWPCTVRGQYISRRYDDLVQAPCI